MAKSKARYLADILQSDGSSTFVGDFSVPASFTIDPEGSPGGTVTIAGDIVSTGPTGLDNASLQNDSITINSYVTALGDSLTLDTDDISESSPSANLWFTQTRARESISLTDNGGDGSLSYNNTTGEFSFTGPSAEEVRAHFSSGTGVTLSSGQISIGQSVATTDAVTFSNITTTTTSDIFYDNSISGMTATDIQSAISELNNLVGGGNVGSQASFDSYEFTATSNQTTFDLANVGISPTPGYIVGYIQVFLNGVLLAEADYNATDGQTVVLSSGAEAGDILTLVALDSFDIANLLRVTSFDASAPQNNLVMDSNGNVGIGITPLGKVHSNVGASTVAFMGGGTVTDPQYPTFGFDGQVGSNGGRGAGMYLPADGELAWSTAGTERMRIDSSGNVHIGTGTDSLANLSIITSGQGGGIQLNRNTSGLPTNGQSLGSYSFKGIDSANSNAVSEAMIEAIASEDHTGLTAATDMVFYTKETGVGPGSAPTPRMRIDSSGHVLVGTTTNTNPRAPLTVFGVAGAPATTGTSAANVALRVATTTGNSQSFDVGIYNAAPYGTWLQATNSGDLTDVSPLVLNPTGGNVGIGTSSPQLKLHVSGTNGYPATSGTTPTGHITIRNSTGATHGAFIGVADASPWGTWIQAQDINNLATNYPLLLNPNGGNVGIGTNEPAAKLDIRYNNTTTQSSQVNGMTIRTDEGGGLEWHLWHTNGYVGWVAAARVNNHGNNWGDGYLEFITAGATGGNQISTMALKAGNVGIGTNEPAAKLVVQDNITHTSNPPTYRGSLIIASDGSQTSAGGLEFHSSIGGGAGYGGRIVTDSSANMLFFARSNSTGWTKTLTIDPTGSAALTGALSINDNPAKFASPVYRGTATGVSNAGYTTLFTATGGGYGSSIKFTLVGTTINVVVNVTADLIVGHSQDILISTQSGFYTTVTLKVTSDTNENFAVEATTDSVNPVTLAIEVFPFSNEQVTFTNSHSYTGSSLTHTCFYGHSTSGTGGGAGDIRTDGNINAGGGAIVIGTGPTEVTLLGSKAIADNVATNFLRVVGPTSSIYGHLELTYNLEDPGIQHYTGKYTFRVFYNGTATLLDTITSDDFSLPPSFAFTFSASGGNFDIAVTADTNASSYTFGWCAKYVSNNSSNLVSL